MLRTLARIVLLLAVLLMPLGMNPAAAAPVHNQMGAGMAMGHCPDQVPGHEKKSGLAECTMACAAALPAMEASDAETLALRGEAPRFVAVDRLHGLHPETATPPPRAS
jgi:hypothetical protein